MCEKEAEEALQQIVGSLGQFLAVPVSWLTNVLRDTELLFLSVSEDVLVLFSVLRA